MAKSMINYSTTCGSVPIIIQFDGPLILTQHNSHNMTYEGKWHHSPSFPPSPSLPYITPPVSTSHRVTVIHMKPHGP